MLCRVLALPILAKMFMVTLLALERNPENNGLIHGVNLQEPIVQP